MDLEVLLRRIPAPLGIGRAASRRLALHFIKSLNVPLTQVGGCTFKRIDTCVESAWFTRLRL